MVSLQRENDELHESLARTAKTIETLRNEVETLQFRLDALTIAKEDLQSRLEQSLQETTTLRNQISTAVQSDPLFAQYETIRLARSLESKTKDFEFLAARYQDASAAA